VGAGVVGLAVARQLAREGREVLLLEKASAFGTCTSSRNSEVIHAGIYYPTGSFKARLCVEGKQKLYRYCQEHRVQHQACGKLIVANGESQVAQLRRIAENARANGVDDLELLCGSEATAMEPALRADAALLSPSTGIVDSHGLMLQLLADFERFGGTIAYNSDISFVGKNEDYLIFHQEDQTRIRSKVCVNSAGLDAINFVRRCPDFPRECVPTEFRAKGSYFSYSGHAPFSHLVYPVPEAGGLGIHLTLDLSGAARFGPNVEWLSESGELSVNDYQVDPALGPSFALAAQQYWPGLDASRLVPDYSGIRPKLSSPTEPAADFLIQDAAVHGIKGLINLFGIESPGLTSCLAIAAETSGRLASV